MGTGKFIFCLGLYRFLYILNWVYRSRTEKNYRHHYLVYVCGCVQTLMYADFFYQYLRISAVAKRCCPWGNRNHREDENGDNYHDDDDDDDDTALIFEVHNMGDNNNALSGPGGAVSAEPLLASPGDYASDDLMRRRPKDDDTNSKETRPQFSTGVV